jgi:ferric-dicitrate binding protein FerR (iron transport regulator)
LEGADREAFERHLATCAACRRELASLAALRGAMRALDEGSPTELELHRTRAAILREGNRRVVAPRPRRLAQLAVSACTLAVFVVLLRAHIRPTQQPVVAPIAAAPDYHVGGDRAALTTRTDGPVVNVTLSDGEASFAVAHLTAQQRFVVATPDAEIEVRGTRFRVLVDDGATKRVVVEEGRVVLRRAGASESILDAGESWSRAEPAEAAADAAPAVAPSSLRHASNPGERFGRAMGAFAAGRYSEADADFAVFVRAFPNDARVEDAAFLRAVARSRLGDRAGAAGLARAYLLAYPTGLHRADAQRLVEAQ